MPDRILNITLGPWTDSQIANVLEELGAKPEDIEIATKLSAGNIGAAKACADLSKKGRGDLLKKIETLKLRGPQVYLVITKFSDNDLELLEMLLTKDYTMVIQRLEEMGYPVD